MADRESLLEETAALRKAAWSKWGTVEPDVLAHALNPTFMGGPRWPAMRQAYTVTTKGNAVLIASDGLSDPYDEDEGPQNENGIGLECFAVTDDPFTSEREGVMRYGASWLHDLVFQTAQQAAQFGTRLTSLLDELETVSLELWNVNIPESHRARFYNAEGRVAVLLSRGAHPIPTVVQGPLSPIRLVHIELLTQAECGLILDKGMAGRAQIVERLRAQRIAPLSRLDRQSVV